MKKLIILFFTAINVLAVNAQGFDDILLPVPANIQHRKPCVERTNIQTDYAKGKLSSASQEKAPMKSVGSPEVIVCFAEFSDVKYTCANGTFDTHEAMLEAVKDSFEIFFNGVNKGVSQNKHSVFDYFKEMSFGKFTPHFNLIAGVTVANPQSYYRDKNRVEFRNNVLEKLSSIIKDDVSKYDSDQNGKVDGVIIVFPGYGQNVVADDSNMGACCWLDALTKGGVTYATQLIAPELYNNKSNAINSIGMYVHEMSHMLGLPDFYDTNYKGSGMDYWSLMDYGEYWDKGYAPTPYTAYERNFMGWVDLVELNEPTTIEGMKSIGEGGNAYVVYNDANHNEYYILENLSASYSWYASQGKSLGSGLIIYHVDYNANAWTNITVNNDSTHQRMTIMPANGHFEICNNFNKYEDGSAKYTSELRGHLFPLKYQNESVIKYYGLKTGNNELTDVERTDSDRIAPAATVYNADAEGVKLMHKPITEITYDQDSHTCSFKFMGGEPTGIESLTKPSQREGCSMVNLSGQKVSENYKGIVIKNGRKYIKQ